MVLTVVSAFAFLVNDPTGQKTQLEVIGIRAVDFKNTITGIGAADSFDPTAKLFQTGDEIEVAVLLKIFNAYKHPELKALDQYVDPFKLTVYAFSENVDFSYAPYNTVRLVSDLFLGSAQFGVYRSLQAGIVYDKDSDRASFSVTGIGRELSVQGQLLLPTLIAGDYTLPAYYNRGETLVFNNLYSNIRIDQPAPDAITYGVVFFGRVKAPIPASGKGVLKVQTLVSAGQGWKNYQAYTTLTSNVKILDLGAGNYKVLKFQFGAKDYIGTIAKWGSLVTGTEALWLPGVAPSFYDVTIPQLTGSILRVQDNLLSDPANWAITSGLIPNVKQANAVAGGIGDVLVVGTGYLPFTGFGEIKTGAVWAPVSTPTLPILAENGIVLYAILDKDSKPIVTLASEFNDDDLYCRSIASFYQFGSRIHDVNGAFLYTTDHLPAQNFVGSRPAAHVAGTFYAKSAATVAALRFFGFNTGIERGYRIADKDFELNLAGAVYSDLITGEFSYGTGIAEVIVDEGTEGEEIIDGGEETVEPETEVPPTGDASIAFAIMAAAIVAAASLAFVLKKAR